jgi:hypothetical protein
MKGWIVKHVRHEGLYFCGGDGDVGRFPKVFDFRLGEKCIQKVFISKLQVPEDWKVVEVEITEK